MNGCASGTSFNCDMMWGLEIQCTCDISRMKKDVSCICHPTLHRILCGSHRGHIREVDEKDFTQESAVSIMIHLPGKWMITGVIVAIHLPDTGGSPDLPSTRTCTWRYFCIKTVIPGSQGIFRAGTRIRRYRPAEKPIPFLAEYKNWPIHNPLSLDSSIWSLFLNCGNNCRALQWK